MDNYLTVERISQGIGNTYEAVILCIFQHFYSNMSRYFGKYKITLNEYFQSKNLNYCAARVLAHLITKPLQKWNFFFYLSQRMSWIIKVCFQPMFWLNLLKINIFFLPVKVYILQWGGLLMRTMNYKVITYCMRWITSL